MNYKFEFHTLRPADKTSFAMTVNDRTEMLTFDIENHLSDPETLWLALEPLIKQLIIKCYTPITG
jgi:hypothetical protein